MTAEEIILLIKANGDRYHCYVLSYPGGVAFYVGVGKRHNSKTYRILDHEKQARGKSKSSTKLSIIREIWNSGQSISYSIAGWFDSRREAEEEERRLIALYGRRDRKTGTLANETAGGQGCDQINYQRTPAREASAKRVGAMLRGIPRSEEVKSKIRATLKGRQFSDETRAKMSAAQKAKDPPSAETRAKQSAANKRRGKPEKFIEAGIAWQREHASDVREALEKRLLDPLFAAKWGGRRGQTSEAKSFVLKLRWQDAAYRDAHLEAVRKPRPKQSANFSDPEWYAKWYAARWGGPKQTPDS